MAKKVFNMQGGLHSAAAFAALENRMYGSAVANAASFVVTPGSGMNLNISTGDGLISVDAFNARRIQVTATETALVSAASASFGRLDTVVAYIDTAVAPVTTVVDNINDILKFKVVPGTAASTPVAPTDAAIQASIGAGNPFMPLYNVLVPQSATNVAGVTLTDRRKIITVIDAANLVNGSVATAKLADSAVTTAKINNGAVTAAKLDPSTLEAVKRITVNGENAFTTGTYKSTNVSLKANVTYLLICEVLWHSTGGGNKQIDFMVNGNSIDTHRSECSLQTPYQTIGYYRPTADVTVPFALQVGNIVGGTTGTFGNTVYMVIPLITTAAIA